MFEGYPSPSGANAGYFAQAWQIIQSLSQTLKAVRREICMARPSCQEVHPERDVRVSNAYYILCVYIPRLSISSFLAQYRVLPFTHSRVSIPMDGLSYHDSPLGHWLTAQQGGTVNENLRWQKGAVACT